MHSLRFKFIFALLAASLTSVVLSGLLAQWMLTRQFNQLLLEESFKRFRTDVVAYLMAYGSWEEARRVENFGQFQARRQAMIGEGGGALPSRPTPEGLQRATKAPPPVRSERNRPPYKFLLIDTGGRVLMGADSFKPGAMVPDEVIQQAVPIHVNGKIAVWAVPVSQPNYSNLDLAYFDAVRLSLVCGIAFAALLALALGIFLGNRLNTALRTLTSATLAMRAGDLRQRVEITSRDEIGVLSQSFNAMSEELARANEEIQAQAQQLKELSIRDELTGLYNRRHFDEQAAGLLTQAKRYDQDLSVMIGDIDFFKRINDSFTHATGDEVLRRIASLLKSNTRQSDLPARYGGEEFVIAFPHTSQSEAHALCEKLRALIEEYPWDEIRPGLRVTISMGVCGDTGQESFERMLNIADARLYHAKQHGRNRVWSDEQILDEPVLVEA